VTLRLDESESEEATGKTEDSSEQPSNVVNGLAAAVTEVAENAGMLQSLGFAGFMRCILICCFL